MYVCIYLCAYISYVYIDMNVYKYICIYMYMYGIYLYFLK